MKKVGLISLGCPKNQVDAEIMLGCLSKAGFTLTNNEDEAEIAIVNTCGFINDAKEESVERIIEAGRLKENGRCKILIVAGCLSERYKKELIKELPEVDAFIGVSEIEKIAEVCKELIDNVGADPSVCPPNKGEHIGSHIQMQELQRILINPRHYAYVKIAEGCDNRCSYCTIPSIRGNYKSRGIESIVSEVNQLVSNGVYPVRNRLPEATDSRQRRLVSNGVKEINIVAQDTTNYGADIYHKKSLADLLKELVKIKNLSWLRILYTYPEHFSDELIDVIANEEKICKYIDIPIQHIDNDILKNMKRKSNEREIRTLIEKLRQRIPDIVLRTSLIVGFPGETEEQYKKLYNFIKEAEFQRLGVFTYSKEEGTPAAEYKNQILQKIMDRRRNEIMELQAKISLNINRELIGKKLKVLIDGTYPPLIPPLVRGDIGGLIEGRYYGQAPEVDGVVYINDVQSVEANSRSPFLNTGSFVNVEITEAHEYDLVGRTIQ